MSLEASELDATILDETEAGFALTPRYTTMPAPGDKPWLYTTLPAPATGAQTPVTTTEADVSDNDLAYLQWHFDYLGDIETIWEEYSGAGVHVGVYDDGLETTHPDLAANYDPSLQVSVDGQIIDPLQSALLGAPHGTAVAGLIAAANNGTGVVGVAWGASLTGVNIFSGLGDINNYYAGFLQAVSQSGNFDVINHSWGKFPGFWQDGVAVAQDQSMLDLWFAALENGRGGLGTIQVKAAGNADQNSNGDFGGGTRATIIVGAYDDDGDASYYSSYGANLLVSAPSSGASSVFGAINMGQVTTDNSGHMDVSGGSLGFGYDGLPDTAYTNGFGGTSGATPIVTGVIALMLEANPTLGWRDVQNIIAYSAHEVGSGVGGIRHQDENNVWKYNGADNWNGGGLHYSEDYGYGGVDAYNAVRMAEVWHLFGGPKASANESSFKQTTTESVELIDGKTTDIHFTFGGPEFTVEFVDVSIDITHSKLDDLEIFLISPDGVASSLIDFRFELDYQDSLEQATLNFGVNAFRGVDGSGEWTIRIVDRWLLDSGTVNSASITLNGTDSAVNPDSAIDDVYHYTDEVFVALARENARFELDDTDGGTDWLDMSAMTGDVLLRMSEGWISNSDGKNFLQIGATTLIENAVTGDGDDDITGTRFANVIYGMRGNDQIYGGGGDDTLSGGAGNDILRGGTGADIFLFDRALNAATNVDIITDYNYFNTAEYGFDGIWLEQSVFSGLSLGTLSEDAFWIGNAANDTSDRIIFDALTGALYFDIDGSGSAAAIQFAVLASFEDPDFTISFDDFTVVDTSATSVVTGSGVDRAQDDAPTTSTSTDTEDLLGGGVPIYGTQYGEEIIGKVSDDIIYGLGGDDTLAGGSGADYIDGGEGIDYLYGQDGNDEIHGGGSPSDLGEHIWGGKGNDVIYGSNQTNGVKYSFFRNGDYISGGPGNDIIYGLDGDDSLAGDADGRDSTGGDDIIYGGAGNDDIVGGWGSDHLYGGTGINTILGGGRGFNVNGFDTVHFEGNYADYRIIGMQPDGGLGRDPYVLTFVRVNGLASGEIEQTAVDMRSVEGVQFADQFFDFTQTPLLIEAISEGSELPDVTLDFSGFEIAALVDRAANVSIVDNGAENGGADKLNFVSLQAVTSQVTISSDVLEILNIANFFTDEDEVQYGNPAFRGDITINAAAGDRTLTIYWGSVQFDAGEVLRDDTATRVVFDANGDNALNGGGGTDYNLSFASADTIKFYQSEKVAVSWFIPNVTTIDLRPTIDEGVIIAGQNNLSVTRIDTALDDSIFATAGGSAAFRYYGAAEQDIIRFGNLGAVNASNDGTTGDDALLNAGLGLRGAITLSGGVDEVRILGSGAFQGGSIDAGTEEESGWQEADVIRMTFGVAGAIGDISNYISGFEIVALDVNGQSHSVDMSNIDGITQITINGTSGAAGENSVHLAEGSTVTIQAVNDGTHFGTLNLTGAAAGLNLAFTAPWVAQPGEVNSVPASAGDGTIHVTDAVVVHITTDSRDDFTLVENEWGSLDTVWAPPQDSFNQILVLDSATTVTISGDTGWDFTAAGTQIALVTSIDASGVTGTGSVGAVIAAAQGSAPVTFIGGAGDDVFTGGVGQDTLIGGAGNDIFEIDAGSAGDSIDGGEGDADTVRSASVSLDLGNYVNVESAILTGTASLNITGNDHANFFRGNSGDNHIDGGAGADTLILTGAQADYEITETNGVVTVRDLRQTGDGVDTITSIEYLQFSDGRHSVNPAAPTDILLSNYTVSESSFEDLLVGELSATDAEGDTATFELVNDSGGRFKLVNGNEIRTVYHTLLDYEQQSTYDITVRVTDGDGLSYEKTLTINLLDDNPEYMVGRNDIDTDDVIWGGAFNDFLAGNGGNDTLRGNGGSDTISGGTGDDTAEYSGNIADYEITWAKDYSNAFTVHDKRSNPDGTGADGIDYVVYNIATMDGELVEVATDHLKFADGVINTWDLIGPSDMELSATSVAENAEMGSVVGSLTTIDLSIYYGETFTYELTDDANGFFALDGDQIVVAGALDFETATSHDITVKVTDGDGHVFEKTFNIGVDDDPNENSVPTVVLENLLPNLKENASTAQPIKIADIVINDDGIGTNRLSVTGRDAAMFQIIGMALFLKAGVLLDAATAAELEFAVAVDDDELAGSPDAVSATYTLGVEDVANYGVIGGTPSSERINGTSGDDVIIGNGGEDDMRGGKGNDTYIVDSAGDKVTEASRQGTDTVLASVSHKLASNVENLTLTGDGDINGTGNSSSNVIIGNDGSNILRGGSGNDTLDGGAGNDFIYGDSGNDTLRGGIGDDYLDGGSGKDNLDGGAGNDRLYGGSSSDALFGGDDNDYLDGGSSSDVLNGGLGADEMRGGSGDDTYYVDDVGDVMFEFRNQGTDTVYSSVGYGLGDNVERLYLTGSDAIDATGNARDNRIAGNEAANVLTGGAGKDYFIFNTALGNGNIDTITDFSVKDDTIRLDNSVFVGVGRDGSLSSGAFFAGAVAHDASDRIIYDKDSGALYFDADGNGIGEQIQFAQIDANLALTYKDFYIV